MDTCGLPLEQFLKFCDTPTTRVLRRTCSALASGIPLGWTRPFIFVTDHPQKQGLPSSAFMRHQSTCTRVEELILCHVTYSGAWVVSPALVDLSELSIVHSPSLTELQWDATEHRRLTSVLIYHCHQLSRLTLPVHCPNLMELSLANVNLTRWTFPPEWRELRLIALSRIGRFPRLVLPATYTQLDTLHLARLDLEELVLEMTLTAPLRVKLQEVRDDRPIRIRMPSSNRQWCRLETYLPILWEYTEE